MTTFGSYVIGYIATDLYTPNPETTELLVKGAYFKIPSPDTVFVKGINTDVNNESAGTITINGGLRMEGAWNNNANANLTDAVFTFEGTSAQSFGGASLITVKGIKMNKSVEKLTLNGDIELSNQLNLLSGNIDLNSNSLTLQNGVTLPNTPSNSSHVIATSGNVIQKIPATGTPYTIPIGDGTNYTPVIFTLNSATGLDGTSAVSFNVVDAKHPTLDATEYITRYFNYNPTNISDPNYDITIHYADADVVGTEANLSFAKNSSGWTQNLGVLANTGNNSLSWAGATSFSAGTGAKDGDPLPIELLHFEVLLNSDQTRTIIWQTGSEINNDFFVVERSSNGINFEVIGQTSGAGNSTSIIDYEFYDNTEKHGIIYYRLKQVDFDGTFAHSKIVSVSIFGSSQEQFSFTIYPNPLRSQKLFIKSLSSIEEHATIEIGLFSVQGKLVYRKSITTDSWGNFETAFNLSHVRSGSYYLRLSMNNKTMSTQKLIINR